MNISNLKSSNAYYVCMIVQFLVVLICMSSAVRAETSITYFHNDLLGSPIAATDQGGNLLWREDYQPYGEKLRDEQSSSINDLWYTGKAHDDDIGLTYFGARYYDPIIGRFMAIDPVGFAEENPTSFNRFAYANNNPYKFVDPDGEFAQFAIGAVLGAVTSSIIQGALIASGQQDSFNFGQLVADTAVGALSGGVAIAGKTGQIGSAAKKFFGGTPSKNVPNPGGRLGKQSTRDHVDAVATELEKRGFKITGGGNRGPEEFLPGPNGGKKGSSFPDITATKNGKTLRVNTIDTRADGVTPKTREATNAARIRSQRPGDHLILIPKPK